jgi:hypothetical protein
MILEKVKKSSGKLQGLKKDLTTSRQLYTPRRSTLGRPSTSPKTLLHLWKSCGSEKSGEEGSRAVCRKEYSGKSDKEVEGTSLREGLPSAPGRAGESASVDAINRRRTHGVHTCLMMKGAHTLLKGGAKYCRMKVLTYPPLW